MTAIGPPKESNMRSSTAAALVIATVLAIPASSPSLAAGDPDACRLLSATEVGVALGVAIGAGQHPASPLGGSGNLRTCQWYEPGKTGLQGKMVQIDIMGQIGSLSPVDRFNNAKRPVQNITKTPVGGVGDDAYYIETPMFTSMNIRKGNSAFEIHVRGASDIKTVLKTLAQEAVSKL